MPEAPRFVESDWIASTADVRVRVNTLAPNEGTPWHWHSVVTDTVFCLEDGLVVVHRAPDERVALHPGERTDVAPGRVHRVLNTTARPLRYLLIQATGKYDFNAVE